MNTKAMPAAFAAGGTQLDFSFTVDETREGALRLYTVRARNNAAQAAEVERFLLHRKDLGVSVQHLFKPGMRSPGDSSRFYTLRAGDVAPYTTLFRTDSMQAFGAHDFILGSMSCYGEQDDYTLMGLITFHTYHGLCVYNTAGDSIEASLWLEGEHRRFDPGVWETLETWCLCEGPLYDCLDAYGQAIARRQGRRTEGYGLAGWSDWEFYRNDKTEADIEASADILEALMHEDWPLDTVVIDGGWAQHLAEWDKTADNIPGGMPALIRRLKARGIRPGLWFAPYITNANCSLVREHPDWLVMDRETGEPLSAGDSNVGPRRTIDFSVPEAMEWLRGMMRMFAAWGVAYLKLDGPVLNHYRGGRFHDPYSTAMRQIHDTLRLMRRELGDTVIIEGEGQYGPSVGICDVHRICQDEHPYWYDPVHGWPVLRENLLTSLLSAWTNRHFWAGLNMIVLRDIPSPFYHNRQSEDGLSLRPEMLMTENEMEACVSANALSGTSLFFSAPLAYTLKSERYTDMMMRMLPVADATLETQALDTDEDEPAVFCTHYDGHTLYSVFNWGETCRQYGVALDAAYHLYDVWRGRYLGIHTGLFAVEDLAPRACRVLAATPANGQPCVLGMDAHLLQSGLSQRYNLVTRTLAVRLHHIPGRERSFCVYLPDGMAIEGVETDAKDYLADTRPKDHATLRYNPHPTQWTTTFTITLR